MTSPAHLELELGTSGSAELGAASFAAALGEAANQTPPGELATITLPAPAITSAALLAVSSADAVLWDPPAGERMSGIGAAATLTATGRGRFASIGAQARDLWSRLIDFRHPAASAPPPRLLGGFAFAPDATDSSWHSFADARFVLPRWCYGGAGDQGWMRFAATAAELHDRRRRDRAVGEFGQLRDLLARPFCPPALPPLVSFTDEAGGWPALVDEIRAAIASGECEKIVAARTATMSCAGPIPVAAVCARLDQPHRDCYRFGFRFDGAAFVGASPERLVARRDEMVTTAALAGSIARTDAGIDADASTLLASGKDRGEQDLVVRAIIAALQPLCWRLEVADRPQIRVLPGLLHLETPIRGHLRQPTHVLDLAAALHPTPAVGGTPTTTAMAWIAAREACPRGWYAAPVGWFDAAGNGEFAVAIRSGLIAGSEARLYAGAGIVAASDPASELAETRAKLRALGRALGVGSDGGAT